MTLTGSEPGFLLLLSLVKSLLLILGAVIAYFAFKAYRRTEERALGMLAVGFGTVTLGALFGGLIHQVLGIGLVEGVLVEGVFVLLGFGFIAYSLYI